MRYMQAKDRSAELLRLTLAHMGRHEAGFNPITFTLWYEYAAAINPKLGAALDQLLSDSARIDDVCVLRLYATHIAPADDETVERIGGEMQRLMASMAQSASQTGRDAGNFGAQLSDLTAALTSQDVGQLKQQLGEVLAGTAEMKDSVDALQQKVSASQEEISRLRIDLDRARGDALIDPLTGILNRKGFDQKLAALLAQPPLPGAQHCLVMLDIDHFKKVNDTHGHVVGDRVIQAVGEILRSSLTDPAHSAARYGGEEFALLLPQTTLAQCAVVAETVRTRTRAMKLRNRSTQELLMTVSISGGVTATQPGDDAGSLVARADAALYESKKRGRDCVTRG